MKHNLKIIGIILLMFVLTQLIGLLVIDAYMPSKTVQAEGINKTTGGNVTVPYGMEPPKLENPKDFADMFTSLAISLAVAIFIFFLLMKIRAKSLVRLWFTIVVFITVSIALTALLNRAFPHSIIKLEIIALALAIPLTFYKVFKRNFIIHNTTELLIYPGLAALFVPILNIWTVLILLVLISIYDMWAVWKSKFMVNLVKFEVEEANILPGFFVPYMKRKDAIKLRSVKQIKIKREQTKALKKLNIKVGVAMLGGGDIAFSLIFAGVIYRTAGLIPGLMIVAGSSLALLWLFLFSKKGKFYPAMPYITAGCIIAWLLTNLI
jgi:presenilin-like A22 family membrane protease